MKTFVTIICIAGLIALGIFVGKLIYQPDNLENTKADYYKDPKFKPDTIIIYGPYIEPEKQGKSIPPAKVTIYHQQPKDYQKSGITQKDITTLLGEDTIPSSSEPPSINPPTDTSATILRYAEFTADTIRLDLQKGNKPITSRLYFSDYSRYKYQFLKDELNISELKTTKQNKTTPKKNFFQYRGTYLIGERDFGLDANSVGAQTGFGLGRIELSGFGKLPINQPINQTSYGVRVGYKLF